MVETDDAVLIGSAVTSFGAGLSKVAVGLSCCDCFWFSLGGGSDGSASGSEAR